MSFTERFTRVLETREELPALPTTALQVRALLACEDVNSIEIASLIARDPALALRLLKAANTAGMARTEGHVTSVEMAVERLGLERVASLCLGVGTIRLFETGRNLDYQRFWTHSVAVGTVAGAIASRRDIGNPSDAYLAGLLHDLGIFFLDQYLPDVFTQMRDLAEPNTPRWRQEIEQLGMDHGRMGAKLLERWYLPVRVVAAVAHHHQPPWDPGPSRQLALVVGAAEALVTEFGEGLVDEGPADPGADAALTALGLTQVEVRKLRTDMAGVVMEAAGWLGAAS